MIDLEGGFGTADVSHALQIVAAWTAALQGDGDLGVAADLLMGILPAHSIRLDRHMVESGRTLRIYASAQAASRPVEDADQCQRGGIVMGDDGKTVTLVLAVMSCQQDTCTIGLSHPLTHAQTGLMQLIAQELARAWARRQPGLITRRIVDQARKHAPRTAPAPT